jgi:DNA-binding PadR family transcriptional regulator
VSKPNVETQNLTKSCNEALILASLREGPRHGYQLALDIEQKSGGTFKFNHGTLYPILHKLEKEGLIVGAWSDEGPKRKRKSYTLTDKGRRYADRQLASWQEFMRHFQAVVAHPQPATRARGQNPPQDSSQDRTQNDSPDRPQDHPREDSEP